jgi:hypothetical protein
MRRLKALLGKAKRFIRKNPVRIQAMISSGAVLASAIFHVSGDALATLVTATLGLGIFSQRIENKKTQEALNTPPPEN